MNKYLLELSEISISLLKLLAVLISTTSIITLAFGLVLLNKELIVDGLILFFLTVIILLLTMIIIRAIRKLEDKKETPKAKLIFSKRDFRKSKGGKQ